MCGVARALDVVGERWALMVVRELLLGPKRFTDLRGDLPHAGPDMLSQRLRDLAAAGVVVRRRLPPPAASQVYELTQLGRELEPVVMALGRFGARSPCRPAGVHELRRPHPQPPHAVRSGPRGGPRATVALRLGDERFRAEVADGRFAIDRGEASSPDATITSTAGVVLAVAHGRLHLDEALAAGDLAIDGDAGVATRFLGLFPLPASALAGSGA